MNWGLHVPAVEYVTISRIHQLLLSIFSGFSEHERRSAAPALGHLDVSPYRGSEPKVRIAPG